MSAKQQEKQIDLLKANVIHLKCLVQEVQLLRRDMAKHSTEQHAALKEWMAKDLDHHFKDNNATLKAIEMIQQKAREKEGEKSCS